MKFKKINESTEAELVNDKESGSNLYEIGLWWGSGYVLDMYKAYAFDGEEALNYVVAYIEKTHPKWLEGSDECAHDMMKEYGEESPEFQETFMYVDATGEGADKPHFIWAENLRIRQIDSSTNESKIGSIKKLANGCKMRDMGDCFVVTDPNGKNIGQCRTEIEAETIAEEYGSKVNESTKKLVKEGAGAGYDIEIKDVKIDKVLKFEESDYKSKYSSEKWYKFEATIKPGIHEIDANTYYDRLVTDYDNEVTIESGTIYGEVGIWEDEGDERTLEEKIRDEIEGIKITISTMYGGGWIHAYLPEDGNIEFERVDFKPDSYSFTIDKFNFKSPEMANVINWNYDHIGEEDNDEDVDPEEMDESLQDGFTTNKEVTKKVEELRQAVFKDSKSHLDEKMSRIAFKAFERALDKAMFDYWDYTKD